MAFPEWMRKEIGKERGWVCEKCGYRWCDGWLMEVHHILPTSMGGRDIKSNALIVCIFCHLKLHEKLGDPRSPGIIRKRIARTGGRWKP